MIWLFLILLFLIGIVVVTTEYVLEYADDFRHGYLVSTVNDDIISQI